MSSSGGRQQTRNWSPRRWTTGDEGATAVEYALMVSLIDIVIVTAVTLVGTNLTALFNNAAQLL